MCIIGWSLLCDCLFDYLFVWQQSGKTFSENVLLDVNKIHFVLASAPVNEIYKEVLTQIDTIISNHECDLPPKDHSYIRLDIF